MAVATKQFTPLYIELKHEIDTLRSALISVIGEDEEGDYNPNFVEMILKAANEHSTHSFTTTAAFLREITKA